MGGARAKHTNRVKPRVVSVLVSFATVQVCPGPSTQMCPRWSRTVSTAPGRAVTDLESV
jgi:hypothetical protein